ncbi:MAG: hypothetical protein M0T71_03570, partial [Actinomycetota bacterium]|nr:hypothetical protein [Actinomycetota bacterium]
CRCYRLAPGQRTAEGAAQAAPRRRAGNRTVDARPRRARPVAPAPPPPRPPPPGVPSLTAPHGLSLVRLPAR